MKFLIKLFAAFAAVVFALVTVIKIVQGCSYKEAVGIAEDLFKDICESCCSCCNSEENLDVETPKKSKK